eukprot:TRINITY_DN29782_c0_g1_i1.p1 TRINITY_DN29782_c0_g1~~TRINITY_DN29782_c0_g1_i1.p1  ORF type:complete len:374 (-),score=56.67 TRINITY_DN29782_c0_g1_i1:188-1309(-)
MWGSRRTSSDQKLSCHSPRVVLYGALAAFFVGVLACYWSFRVLHTESFDVVVDMLDVDRRLSGEAADFGHPRADTAVTAVLVCGFVIISLSVIGCVGVSSESPGSLCVYMCGAGAGALLLLGVACSAMTFAGAVIPVTDRQAAQLCNATFHETYAAKLGCDAHSSATHLALCYQDCEEKVALARALGGCKMFDVLCHDFEYAPGPCAVGPEAQPWTAPAPEDAEASPACAAACNSELLCTAFLVEPGGRGCTVLAPEPPTTKAGGFSGWVPGSADATPDACLVKSLPRIPLRAGQVMRTSAILAAVLALVLALAGACAWQLQYTLTTRRKGNKGAGALCTKMLCPCFGWGGRGRKFEQVDAEESDGLLSSDPE